MLTCLCLACSLSPPTIPPPPHAQLKILLMYYALLVIKLNWNFNFQLW